MPAPDFSKFKEACMNAWEQVFQRLDKLENKNQNLRQRLEKLERESK